MPRASSADQDQGPTNGDPQGGRSDGGSDEGAGHVDRLVGGAVVELNLNESVMTVTPKVGVYSHDLGHDT